MGELLQEALVTLQASGGRMTLQRRLILETLETLRGHPNAEQVYLAVSARNPEVHRATVYRTLGWLADEGLLNTRHLDGTRGDRCEHYDSATLSEHHHFVCTHCQQVIEFQAPEIRAIQSSFAARHHVHVERASLTLYGLCDECR